jgi:Fanconi anemia group M protein
MELRNVELREYQKNILNSAKSENTLVILPTGLGKTLIALKLAIDRINQFKDLKVLFLAPTRPLVNQHRKFFLNYSDLDKECVIALTGGINPKKRSKLWKDAIVVLATPQTIMNDLKQGLISLEDVCLLIIDECHRSVKNYAYVFVAKEYIKQAKKQLIIGLTASPGHSKADIEMICKNLGISNVEMRSEEDEDVKPYIKTKVIERIFLEMPGEMIEIKELMTNALRRKLERLKEMHVIESSSPSRISKKKLLLLNKRVAKAIERDKRFFGVLFPLVAAIKINHALELLQTQGLYPLKKYLDKLEKENKKTTKEALSDEDFRKAILKTNELIAKNIEIPKFEKLSDIICSELNRNKNAKFIVFTQYRDTVKRIVEYLKRINGISPTHFIGQAGIEGMCQDEQIEILRKFESGEYNVLVGTSIAEEGLHIPMIDVAIFFEPIPSALRTIQRRGRVGRTKIGKIYVLIMKGTIDEGYYYVSLYREKSMKHAIESMKKTKKQMNLKWFT